MKKIFMMLLMVGASVSVFAQATREYKGAVIDSNGNPLPGAKVEATGGAENTVTDADGTFTLEASQWLKSITITYPGMAKEKKKVRKNPTNLVVTMDKRQSSKWFVNAQAAFYFGDDYDGTTSIGVMGGKKGYWGWYAKVMYDVAAPSSGDSRAKDPDHGFTLGGGGIKSISKNLYFYLGGGVMKGYERNSVYYTEPYTYTYGSRTYTSYNYISYKEYENQWGGYADLGFMYSVKMINVNLGLTARIAGGSGGGFHVGVGYTF